MRLNGKLISQLSELIILTLLKTHWYFQRLLFKERNWSIQSGIAHPTFHHTPKETMHGTMPSTTNPMRLPGVERPTPPLPITSTGSLMMVEDLLQLLQFLHRRNKGLFHSMIGNQLSALMSKEMMLGLTIKLIRQMKLNGKLTFLQWELTILTQLKLQMRRSKLMKLKLHLWFKERDKSTQ